MTLPKLDIPTFTLTLPSTNQKVKYRPFLVKEYKTLLTTMESDTEEILRIVTDLVDVCTFNTLDVASLANFDIEYLFLNIRAKSIGEITKLNMPCKNCNTNIDFEIDLTKIQIEKNDNHDKMIKISEDIGLEMRYPRFDEMVNIYQNFNSDNIVSILSECISTVYTKDDAYSEFTKDEMEEFVGQFSKEQFDKIEEFFLTMPKVVQRVENSCTNCGTPNNVNLEGLQNFFV